MTGTSDNNEDVPTLLSWSAGDDCSVRAPRRVCSTAVCDLTCSTGLSSLSAACQQEPNCRTILSPGPVPGPRPARTQSIGVLRRHLALPRSLAPRDSDRGDAETGRG